MKKILISLISIFIVSYAAFATEVAPSSLLKKAIFYYKQGNYIDCLKIVQKAIEKDPSDALARYYHAMTLVKFGHADDAKTEYNNVIQLNSSEKLTSYAKVGLVCIDAPEKCSSKTQLTTPAIVNPKILPTTDDNTNYAKNFMEQKKLDNIKDIINTGQDIQKDKIKTFQDFSKNKSAKPSDEEIVKAMETLKNAGLGGFSNQYTNPYSNPEMMQMNMLMSSMGGMNNNGAGNNSMNMMPLLMMQQQNADGKMNIDPKILQTMMMSSMMPNLNGFDSNNNQN